MVFAAYIAFILSTYLGKFIKGLDKDAVNVSLLRGSIELKKLELLPDLLSFCEYLQLESGTIRSLSVTIPWHFFYSKRCEVVVRDVSITVAPKHQRSDTATEFFRSKKEFLTAVQGVLADAAKREETQKDSKSGLLNRLQQAILKNLAFRLENLSFQLEDKTGCWKGQTASVQAQFDRLTCEATDSNYKSTFVQPGDSIANESLYRLVSYDGVSVRLLYSSNEEETFQQQSSQFQNSESMDSFMNAKEVLVSSEGSMTIYLQKQSATVQAKPCVSAALITRKTTLQWSAPCTTAIGILFESMKQAPRRAFFGDNRPASRIRAGDPAGTSRWWSYAIGKVVTYQKARRDRRRFDWAAYQRRKLFLASLFTFCLQLLKVPWLPDNEEQSLSEDQLVLTSAEDVMACWNAARECFAQFQRTKRPPQGSAYEQYLQYFYVKEQKSREEPLLELSPLIALPAEIALTIECAELAVSLDQNLRGVTNQACIGVTASKDKLCLQLSAATATVVAEADEGKPVLAITGSDTAGVLLMASKLGHSPATVDLVIEEIVTCLDLSFQELLATKVTSYIVAARPFLNQDFSDVSTAAVLVGNKVDHLEMRAQQELFSSFGIIMKSITGKADGLCLRAQRAQLAVALGRPPVAEIQEISATVNDTTLLQLCSVAVTSAVGTDSIRVEVVTYSAHISTNVEGFEYVKLLLGSMRQQWSSCTNSFVSRLQARSSGDAKQNALSKKSQVNLALRFEFVEYGALGLEALSIRTTFCDGWHLHLSAVGGTTEGCRHSLPPRSQEPFIDIHVWAGDFLVYSSFADSVEGNGIAFTCNFNHVTLCLSDDLISSLESLYDTVMTMLYDNEDRHVYLSERDKCTTPQIIGLVTGSHMMLLLDSKGGNLTLLRGHADTPLAAATAAGSADFRRPRATSLPTPPPLTVEFLGEECLHVSLQRYRDTRMDIHVVLQRGVNAYLIGTPAHIPLFVPRDSMRAEVDFHFCSPSDADLPIFPYGRLNVAMKLSNVATVMHIPTLAAVWTYFTPPFPLFRLRNIGSRLHFSSSLSHPGVTLAPRSPASAAMEALGAAAFARISHPAEGGARSSSAPLPTHAACDMYSAPVFPSDMRVSVVIADSELYYPWGEGSVAPLYLHAALPNCEAVMLSRDGCVEVTVRGFLAMPRVRTALHAFPHAMSETTAQRAGASTTRTAADNSGEHGAYEEAPPPRTSEEHAAMTTDAAADGSSTAYSPAAAQPAFPSEEDFAAPQQCASPPPASSLIQVHMVYTMDSRPPFSPGNPDEFLRVSLTATAAPGSGALPGPLHATLHSPTDVAAWLTFFTFFNLTNTVPLSTSSCAAAALPTFVPVREDNSGGSILTAAAQNPRRLIMNVHTSPIVFHLPFAAAAAVLWEGLDFVASPGYSALRIPKLDVLVHEQLWCTAATGVATSVQRLATLRDSGYAVLALRSSSSGSIGEVDMVPAILFESHATGPTAAEVRQRLVLPAIVGHLAHATTLVQLQQCSTLAAVSAIFAARSVQTALLNAVILQESQRRKLRYACCCTTPAGGGGSSSYSSGTDADAEAQLRPLLSPPLAIHIHSGCLTFEWMSELQQGLRAGVTVAATNARCNDYNAHNRLSVAQPTDDRYDTTAHSPQRLPLATSMPLIVEVEAVEAYVWWTNAGNTSTAEAAVGEEVASLEDPQSTSKQRPSVPSVTACMPLLLYPFQVHTSIDTAAQAVDVGTGEAAHENGTTAAAASGTCVSVQQEDARVAASEEELETSFAVSSGDDTIGTVARRSQSLSSATFHTMLSTSSDGSSVTAAAVPATIMYPMRPAEALPTSVFLVTPIHVVLNNSAYVVLSEMLLHKVQGTSAATAAGAQGAVAEATPPASHSVAIVSQYYLTHCVMELPTAARGSAAASRASVSSPFPPLACSKSGLGSSGGHASSSLARAQAVGVKTMWVFRYDSAPKQHVWVESQSQPSRQLGRQQPYGDNSVDKEEERRHDPSLNDAAEIAEVEKRRVPMSHIPLSALHATDEKRMLSAPAAHDGPANLRGTRIHEGHSKSSSPSMLQEEQRREPHQRPRPSARVTVAEVCLRLVYYRDVETVAAAVSEERGFWRRYAAVHASARHAAAASPASTTATQTPCLMTFLAASVAPLRSLHPTTTHSNTARSCTSRNASPLMCSRTPLRWGKSPASPASAQQQQFLAPTAMLEEACVDALCVRLTGIIVSSFTDARSVQLESCVCTSVKSPSRPLLSTTRVELYVPSSIVAYASAGEAAKTVARDLQGAACVTEALRGMETAPEAAGVSASPTMSPKDTNAMAAPSVPVLPPQQPSEATRQAKRSYLADSPSSAAAPTAGSTSVDDWNCNGDGDHRQAIVMQGEVGCRLETLTVDLSAAALRAWLSCLVEQPVAALRAATEEEKRAKPVADRSQRAVPVATPTTPILLPMQWKPGQGLRVYEIREAFWDLEHDITLSRDGLVLVFSSQETNLLTVHLNGHDITFDPSLLLLPAGLQRVVMVVQGGLTVRFVGSGRVRLPLALWSSSLVEMTANVGLETALLPFMAIGEGSYLECSQVRLGFVEPSAESSAGGGNGGETAASTQRPVPDSLAFTSKAAEGSEDASADASPPPPPSSHGDLHQSQLVHRNVHLYMPHISVIIEPRRESRQLRIRTAVESWISLCNGRLLRDDVRCTGFMILSESAYDAATTTARTTVLAPVDVNVCSNNGRHHAVSLGTVQVDLGRADVLIMSTYAGELQVLWLYAKYLTHSKVERAFLELVEATLAWKASGATTNNAGVHGEEDEHDSEFCDADDSSDKSGEEEGDQERPSSGLRGGGARERTVAAVPPARTNYARANHTSDAFGAAASTATGREGAVTIDQPWSSSTGPRRESHRQSPCPATLQGSATHRTDTTKALLRQAAAEGGEVQEDVRSRMCAEDDQMRPIPAVDVQRQQQRRQRQRRRQRLLQRRQSRGLSWVVFTPSVEVIFSDHRHPLVQVCVQDVMVRRTSSSALASTSLVRCQRASVRVHGRGRWDVLLKPSAALTWSLTQTVSRHSSNRQVSLVVNGVHWQCSHLIVAKLLYMNHQFSTLATSLRRRLTMAAAAGGEASSAAAPASVADVPMTPAVTLFGGEDDWGRDASSDTTAGSSSASTDGDEGSDSGYSKSSSSSSRRSSPSTDTFSDTSSRRQRRQLRQDAVAMGAGGQSTDSSLTIEATPLSSSLFGASSSVVVNEVPNTAVTTADDRLAATMRPTQRGGHRRSSVTAGSGAPVATAAVSPGMATHRLLNSFSHTLFAGICECVAVAKVSATATPDALSAAVRSTDSSSLRPTAETAAPMLWRCNELYRLPPASTTDIFISYRHAHSLILTFFSAECVEWDGVNCAWTLNAEGEAALAARTVASAAKPSTAVPPPRQQEQLYISGGADSTATTNWFAFTSLQYGMARALTVRTTAPRGAAAAPASTSATATGMSGCGCKVLAYWLALTCVDPEEEADTSRYPIVVASGEGDDDGLTPVLHQQQQHRRHARRRSFTASSVDPSTPPSRGASSMCVDSLKKGGALLGGSTPKGAAPQMARGSSSRRTGASHRTSDDFVLAQPAEPLLHRSHDLYDRLRVVQCGDASAHSLPDQRRSSATILTTTGNQKPAAQRRGRPHSGNTARVPPAVHRQRLQPPYHAKIENTPVVSWQDTERSGGDLLVVRLQARSSLFNETGCTLQLLSSLQLLTTPNSVDDASSLCATLTTVPPGWQLPLNEEDVRNEVVLRVCCPSARWLPSPAAPSATAAPPTGMTDSGHTAGVAETMDDATAHLRWYEARTVLGQLQSGRFLYFRRVDVAGDAVGPPVDVTGAATAKDSASSLHGCVTSSRPRDDHDERLLILFVIHTYSADGLVQHIFLYPRLTLMNHLGLTARVGVFQQDPLAGPQTPDEAMLIAQWTAPRVGRGLHDQERFYRSLVALGTHDALPHQRALPLHFCTYGSNLVLGLSFTQSTGDAFFTADLHPVITHLRDAVDHHPRLLQLRDSHGRAFYVQVSVMSRTVVLSVALWVYNLTEYPLLMSDSFVQRRLCPGQSSTSGIIPSQGEPFLIGCRLADFTQGFFAIGMDGGWSSAVPINVGSSGVFVSALSRLGITRSCNYSILFPNAQEGRPMVIQITPRWVFYNNTPKQLRLQFRFPGLETAMQQAEKQRRRLRMREMDATTAQNNGEAAAAPFQAAGAALQGARHPLLLEADDTVGAFTSIAAVQLNPGDYHVSCIGPIEGNQFRVQEVLQGIPPTATSIHATGRVGYRDGSSSYESQYTPYMDVDRPGEATFNLWAAPRALGKQVAVNYGSDLIVQRPSAPHPTELEPHDMYSTDAIVTGRIAVAVQSAEDVLAVILQPIQGTKILLQNRTESHTVMVRQLGNRRRNCIPPRQNRFFLWEDARQEHIIRVHLLGYKGRWFDVDFSAGECQVARHVDTEDAAAAEALDHARQLRGRTTAAANFSFHVRGYTNTEKTRVTILVTEAPVPVYAAIDSWRTSQAVSLRMTMVQLSWTQEMSTYVATAAKFAAPFAIDDGSDGVVDNGASGVVAAPPSSVANATLFSIILEGVQLDRLITEDNENFYLAVHQMQWVDEKRKAVFVYRARPRLPPAMAMLQAADAAQGSAGAAAATLRTGRLSSVSRSSLPPPSRAKPNGSDRAGSPTRRRQLHRAGSPAVGTAPAGTKSRDASSGGYGALLEPITATANHLLSTALGRSDAFLLCMEKQNDLELSYSLIKYADGVTRYTELRHVLTPLVVVLTDFWLVDIIQEVRRLRVLLGLRRQTADSQTTTAAPLMLTVSSLRQQQRSRWRAFGDEDTGSAVMDVVPPGKQAFSNPCTRPPYWQLGQRSSSVVVVAGDTEAAVLPSEQQTLSAQATPRRRRGRRGDPLSRRGSRDRSRDSDKSSATAASSVHTGRTGSSHTRNRKAGEMRSANRSLTTTTPTSPRRSSPSRAVAAVTAVAVPPQQQHQQGNGSTAGFLSQAFFLQQLVQEVRTRLEKRGTDVMAGSLTALATRREQQLQSGSEKLLLLAGGIAGVDPEAQHRQLLRGATSTPVRHHQSAMHRGGPSDGLGGVTTVDAEGNRAVAEVGGSGVRAAGDGGVGSVAATAHTSASSVNTASFMFIERLEVQRVTLYVTFVRHSPDPLRPLLGAYSWMLPSQLSQREFYLPAWTLTRQVETPASLRARLVRWGMHSLREQWTKVTKLGTLLDALKFWQHRTLLLHGAPRPLTLSRVQQQQQQQERGGGGGQPLATFAPCVSSGEEEDDENTDDDDGNVDPQRGGAQVQRPVASMEQRR